MNGCVLSGVSLMLNPRGSTGRFRGGGLPFVLRLPGGVNGVYGPCDVRRAPSVTGDVNGVEGGTRFGSRRDLLPWALCVPGSVNGAGSNGRCVLAVLFRRPLLAVAAY